LLCPDFENGGVIRTISEIPMRVGPAMLVACFALALSLRAQVAPSAAEKSSYTGLLAAAARGDAVEIRKLIAAGGSPDVRDMRGRTPLHVATHGAHHEAMRALMAAGANPNTFENDRYDILTIAAVANDVPTLKLALELGANPKNVTSIHDGTALIAAAHLGHSEVVKTLIRAGAPLDHVNNLGFTAVIESIILGDGGPRHIATLRALAWAGANLNLPDGNGRTPYTLARILGHTGMMQVLEAAGAHKSGLGGDSGRPLHPHRTSGRAGTRPLRVIVTCAHGLARPNRDRKSVPAKWRLTGAA